MKTYYLLSHYKAKVQVLDKANADEILERLVFASIDPKVMVRHNVSGIESGKAIVDPENPDFFNLDIKARITVDCEEEDLEDLGDKIELDVDGLFAVWDFSVEDWNVEEAK